MSDWEDSLMREFTRAHSTRLLRYGLLPKQEPANQIIDMVTQDTLINLYN